MDIEIPTMFDRDEFFQVSEHLDDEFLPYDIQSNDVEEDSSDDDDEEVEEEAILRPNQCLIAINSVRKALQSYGADEAVFRSLNEVENCAFQQATAAKKQPTITDFFK